MDRVADPAPAAAEVPDAVSGMAQPPATPLSPAPAPKADPLLGANPELMPNMDLPPDSAPTAKLALARAEQTAAAPSAQPLPPAAAPSPVRNMEFLSPHHRLTCSVRDWELASKVASPL